MLNTAIFALKTKCLIRLVADGLGDTPPAVHHPQAVLHPAILYGDHGMIEYSILFRQSTTICQFNVHWPNSVIQTT